MGLVVRASLGTLITCISAGCGGSSPSPTVVDAGGSTHGSSGTSQSTHAASSTTSAASTTMSATTAASSSTEVTSSSSTTSSASSSATSSSGLTGGIAFSECIGGSCGAGSFTFSATFNYLLPCAMTVSGGCTLMTCAMVVSSGDDAGTLSISGGSISPGTTVPNMGDGLYNSPDFPGAVFTSGTKLTVSSTGGMVPAFGPVSVTAPSLATITAPIVADAGTTKIPISTDLTVSWTGGQSGSMVTFGANGEMPLSSLSCAWDASLGKGVVPHTLLSQVGAGAGSVSFGAQATTTFKAGAYTITDTAAIYSPTGVTFQ